MYTYSICACIKDEQEYLDEWVNWHLSIGFEHIWLFDNYSINPLKNYIKDKPYKDKITVIEWKETVYPQVACYRYFMKELGKETKWVSFIDIDEFYHFRLDKDLPTFMSRFGDDIGGICFNWRLFNADGQLTQKPGLVRDRFKKQIYNIYPYDGKYIARPETMEDAWVHRAIMKPGYKFVMPDGETEVIPGPLSLPKMDFSIASIDHYYTKSLEEWVKKIKRGTCDEGCRKRYLDFFDYNTDLKDYIDQDLVGLYQRANCDKD